MAHYLTVTQAAGKLGKTRSWVHQLLQAGRIPGAKAIGERTTGRSGRIWLIPSNFKVLRGR